MDTVVIQKNVPGKSATEIMARIKELMSMEKRNQTELVKVRLEMGWLFNRLKDEVPGGWSQRLENQGLSQRRISRLMKSAKVLAPSGTVPQRLAAKLPADPLKLEALSALDLKGVESLVSDKAINLRELDRNDISELVRNQLGVKSRTDAEKPTGVEAIRQNWNGAVETLFQKLKKLEVEEREQFIVFLDESLDRLKESLHKVDEEVDEEGMEPEGQEGDEAVDQEGEDAKAGGGESDTDEKEATKEEEEVPEPKAPAPKGSQPVGRRAK